MKINLRKANALQHAINEELVQLRQAIKPGIVFDPFDQDPQATIKDAAEAHNSNMELYDAFQDAYYDIRNKVAVANHEAGINEKLARVARIEKGIQLIVSFASIEPQTSIATLTKQLEKAQESESRYDRMTVQSSFLSNEEIANFKKNLNEGKRKKQQVQDELLELNMLTKIDLAASTVTTLEEAGIL